MAREYHFDNRMNRYFYGEGSQRRYMPVGWLPPEKVPTKRSRGRAGVEVTSVTAPASGGMITTRRRVPRITTGSAGTIVHNTEGFVDVNAAAAGAFSVTASAVIPTSASWLAGLADLYSKYRWRKLRFVYIPGCPTSTQGNGAISIAYDRIDASPTTLVQMQQSYKAITHPAYAGYDGAMALQTFNNVAGMVAMDIDTSRFAKPWYPVVNTTTFAAMATNVQTSYCPCTIYTGSVNGPTAATYFGTWYIQYEIEFIEPVNPTVNV